MPVSTARPSAPPICCEVLRMPEARPERWCGTPSVAEILTATNVAPIPTAMTGSYAGCDTGVIILRAFISQELAALVEVDIDRRGAAIDDCRLIAIQFDHYALPALPGQNLAFAAGLGIGHAVQGGPFVRVADRNQSPHITATYAVKHQSTAGGFIGRGVAGDWAAASAGAANAMAASVPPAAFLKAPSRSLQMPDSAAAVATDSVITDSVINIPPKLTAILL